MRFVFILLLGIMSVNTEAANDSAIQQIKERIQPIGKVRLAEEVSSEPVEEKSGQIIYEQHCSVCHRDGLAGAPRFQVATDWQQRLDDKTLDELVASAMKGMNAMPAKGTCTECSEADLKNAIQYMLPQHD
ncbi:c-type cytochrome [Legionella fairfieldensis]|uniref:c-type cytochrome n=1 Tax=Legionella fairfieldensis TaxID=45064 RepID=UPI000491DE76|nr:c-type cytochrome [Legionella fairfieldensis]